ncbi:type III-B CRISPR module RAMP protein Cmr6 [Candidatus Halobeggiatoa sp. HSG11]|nr:type III-B CRISPR module RAMP protein Cmr6 [Candidatus Halobeggiatoa sp. HSG11]
MTRIPLYDEESYNNNRVVRYLNEKSHFGLWFTRFFNEYNNDWEVPNDGKTTWINSITTHKKCGDMTALANYKNRTLNLIKTLKNKPELSSEDFAICETNWNFVTGMGLPHPVENGMSWHHTLGVPYLAGSSMKGLLRAWVESGWNEELDENQTKQRRRDWFGMVKGEDGDDKDQAGKLIFFDAIPIEPVKLIPDIMTPHYGDWYAEGGNITSVKNQPERIPADWHDPVPVPFLAVKDTKFLVTVVARDKKNDDQAKLALKELVEALQWLGAGAKTAAGYGHLDRKTEEEQNILQEFKEKEITAKKESEKKQILNELSDLEREVYLSLSEGNQSEGETKAGDWLNKMEAVEPEDAKKIAIQLQTFYEKIGKWKNPSKKKQKPKVDRVKKILGEV